MHSDSQPTDFTSRELVALIRAELVKAGRSDLPVERIWIDQDESGFHFLMRVPVGADLAVPLKPTSGFSEAETGEERARYASQFAKALINLRSAEGMLAKYARDVRRAAVAAVAEARAEGLDVLLEGVGFKPTYAYHLSHQSWKEAALHVLAEVSVRHTSFYLRPHSSSFWVEEPADVGKELKQLLEEQRERQERIAALEARGADLVVDAITLDLLAAHDLEAGDVLRKVLNAQCVNLSVQHRGRDTNLSLISSAGRVTASIVLEDAFWNGEHLWLRGDEQAGIDESLVGSTLGNLVNHPAFAARPIVSVDAKPIECVTFDLSDEVLFDSDTGRLWREERLAA